jgi:hypothetical protein
VNACREGAIAPDGDVRQVPVTTNVSSPVAHTCGSPWIMQAAPSFFSTSVCAIS